MNPAERIIVALDCPRKEALELADCLQGEATWLKVGMTLYYAEGPAIIRELKERGYKVFVDLKFHDIPHQVKGAAASVVNAGADMFTVHASGGREMLKAALAGAQEAYAQKHPADADKSDDDKPKVIAITVLTSMDTHAMQQVGITRSVLEQVDSLAMAAVFNGLDGVVASAKEAQNLRTMLGKDALIVTPGIRPAGTDPDDQKRVATPAQALMDGASYLVIGRPITKASDPRAAFMQICEEIRSTLDEQGFHDPDGDPGDTKKYPSDTFWTF